MSKANPQPAVAAEQTGARPEEIRAEAVRFVEQLWCTAEAAARRENLKVAPNWGERPFERHEIDAIVALIDYQAAMTGLTAYNIDIMLCSAFGAERLEHIKKWNFDHVIRYLVEFKPRKNTEDSARPGKWIGNIMGQDPERRPTSPS